MGVARPPARTVIAQAFAVRLGGVRELVSEQPGGNPLCHPRATSETIPPQPSAFFAVPPSSGPTNPKEGYGPPGAAAPATPLPWPTRGLEGGRPAAGSREETATLTARLPIEWAGGRIHAGERPGVPMTTRRPLCSVSLKQMTNFPAFKR